MQVHRSNRVEVLADVVGRLWSSAPGGDPFAADVLVVQSEGMAQWLRVRLARTLGVVARVEVQRPRQLLDAVLQAATGRSQGAAWRPDRLAWALLGALDEVMDADAPGGPGPWLAAADAERRFQLAQRLADLFDQYAVYRPELVLGWEAGAEPDDWQARLWRALVARLGGDHPAALAREALGVLSEGEVEGLPARVVIFGISALPPLYLRLFAALSERAEVHLAVLAPSETYWSAERRGWSAERRGWSAERRGWSAERRGWSAERRGWSAERRGWSAERAELAAVRRAEAGQHGPAGPSEPEQPSPWADDPLAPPDDPDAAGGLRVLLGSLGKVGADLDDLLVELDAIGGDDDGLFEAPPADTLLGVLQRGLRWPEEAVVAPVGCSSVRVLGCHGPLREVEAAADAVRGVLEANPELSPRDVVVLTPSLDVHGPLLDAVWGVSPDHPRYVPWSLADRRQLSRNACARALLDVLALAGGRLGAAEVLALLQHAPLRDAFELEEDDAGALVGLVEAAGVRWGADGQHRAQAGWPDDLTSWRAGLDRALLGVALDGADLVEAGGAVRAPLHGIRGDAAQRAGRLAALVDAVLDAVADAAAPRSVAAWQVTLLGLVEAWFAGVEERAGEVRSLREAIAELGVAAEEARFAGDVPLAVVRGLLDRGFRDTRHPGGFLRGGVTVCELLPMRAVPFEVVVLLGISDGVFPRSDSRWGFDRLAAAPRPGDRSRRDDDRWMFLEALLSARRALIITSVCRDERRDKELPPSPVVHELIEAVASVGGDLRVEPVPLQPFSAAYARPDGPLTWDRSAWRAACRVGGARGAPHDLTDPLERWAAPDPLPARLLVDVLRDPVGAYVRHRLGARWPQHDGLLPEHDPVLVDDSLDRWAVRDAWLRARLRFGDRALARRAMLAAGRVPGGALAAEWRATEELIEAIAGAVEPLVGGRVHRPVGVSVALAAGRLVERVEALPDGVRVVASASDVSPARVALHLPMHLAACAGGVPLRTEVIGKGTGGAARVTLAPVAADEARVMLESLVDLATWCLDAPRQVLPRSVVGGASDDPDRLLRAMVKEMDTYGASDAWRFVFGERGPETGEDAARFAAALAPSLRAAVVGEDA